MGVPPDPSEVNLMRLSAFARAHPNAFTALGLCATVGVGLVDYKLPWEVSFSIFYLLPVAAVTWYVGLRRGVFVAVASIITWGLANTTPYIFPGAIYWKAGVRLAFFVIICLLLTKLKSAQTLLQQANAKLLDVQEKEQEFLGKQLRDSVGHEVQSVSNLLHNLRPQVNDPSVKDSLDAIASRCQKVAAEVSQMSHTLCPEVLGTQGLAAAIKVAARAWEMPEVKVKFTCQNGIENTRFGTDVELTLFRIAQEAVSNAASVAGVETVEIELFAFGDWVMLTVMGDGLSITDQQSPEVAFSMGVMKGRIEAVGGEFKATSPPGQLRVEAKVRQKTSTVHNGSTAVSA